MFHDLRHTAKTIARKAGVDKNVRMVIVGHSNSKDLDLRYDTVDEDDLINAIDRVEMYLQASEKQENSQYQKYLVTIVVTRGQKRLSKPRALIV